ncbi:EAL domain-containing protein [Rhodovastum atsumiense]|uniref:EAL domain-containing protein n=1 Tax=Rhodovastum atsumiense TaxID=504468 RepID=A0A5M6IR80_9PROT|nr:EAL domain-containing protein [Rhodovastum atsumiense]KAA5610419.1 EAL domain-containing protein [Rhodovastum atsumiense]CAH2602893.1 EAL domain-containing protein [Rhodovastum atsumiense]
MTMNRLFARWPLLVAVAFCAYASVLLWNGFRAQAQLTAAAEARFAAEAARQAARLGDFLAERRSDISELADAHEIEAYLTNKALGMSLRYGLAASLEAIEQRLRRWQAKTVFRGQQIFGDIAFVDIDGTRLAELGNGDVAVALPSGLLGGPVIALDPVSRRIGTVAPVRHKGAIVGAVVAFSDLGILAGHLRADPDATGLREVLLSAAGEELAAVQVTPALDPELGRALVPLPAGQVVRTAEAVPPLPPAALRGMVVVRTPVPGFPLSLATLAREQDLYGTITSRAFLHALSVLPPLVLLAALMLDRMQRRNLALQARYLETARRRDELYTRNTALSREISRREAVEAALRESEQRLRKLFDAAPLPGYLVDPSDTAIVDCNDAAAAMLGYTRDMLRRMRVSDIAPDAERCEALWRRPTLMGEAVQFETRHRTRSGEMRDVVIAAVPVDIGGRRLACSTVVDITERKLAEARILYLAQHDALTGLPNRMLLTRRIAEATAAGEGQGGGFVVLSLDLDGFKAINDTMGREVGDTVLCRFAERLRALVRPQDTVARTGGDAFTILVRDLAPSETAEQVAQRLLDGLPLPVDQGGYVSSLCASIGIALYPDDGADGRTLLKNADTALDRAKAERKGGFCRFEGWMDRTLADRRALERDLRLAVERRELEVFFQPQFACDSLRVVGFEALIRWRHPERGFVSPGVFIPLAEECGLIVPIGRMVLEQSCTLAAGWQPRCRVAVNLSPVQFRDTGLLPLLSEILHRTGLPAALLELEVTEGVLIKDEDQALATLRSLKDLGVHIALDDFGTGYSSLSYLRRFPFDGLKIDKCFVQAQQQDSGTRTILEAVLTMSQRLNLRVVAEGVETQEQLAMLREQGCTELQGFLLGRPMPAHEVPDFLARVTVEMAGREGGRHLRLAVSNAMPLPAPRAAGQGQG